MPTKPHIVMICLPDDTPDRRTALADLRTALCLHKGVDIDDIDPARGYDLSLASYLRVRASWEYHIREWGLDSYARSGHVDARAYWERHRPQYLAEYPWPEEMEGAL